MEGGQDDIHLTHNVFAKIIIYSILLLQESFGHRIKRSSNKLEALASGGKLSSNLEFF